MLIRSFSIDHGEGSKLIGTNSKNVYFDTFSSAALQFYMHAKPKRRHKLQRQTSMLFGHPQCQDSRSLCKVSKSMPGTLSGEASWKYYFIYFLQHDTKVNKVFEHEPPPQPTVQVFILHSKTGQLTRIETKSYFYFQGSIFQDNPPVKQGARMKVQMGKETREFSYHNIFLMKRTFN